LRPIFLSKNSNLNVALGVIGTIGGLYYFGIVGLILGPLILAYILIIFDFYREGKLSELFKK
jgi:predicted PurR-regulated permease PerM